MDGVVQKSYGIHLLKRKRLMVLLGFMLLSLSACNQRPAASLESQVTLTFSVRFIMPIR
jgi:hypothetical protein